MNSRGTARYRGFITTQTLIDHHATGSNLDLFSEAFPAGMKYDFDSIQHAVESNIEILWLAQLILTPQDFAIFNEKAKGIIARQNRQCKTAEDKFRASMQRPIPISGGIARRKNRDTYFQRRDIRDQTIWGAKRRAQRSLALALERVIGEC